MPTFSPTIALVATFSSSFIFLYVGLGRHTDAPPGHENPNGALDWLAQRSKKWQLNTSVVRPIRKERGY
jgi:hypothetical protein